MKFVERCDDSFSSNGLIIFSSACTARKIFHVGFGGKKISEYGLIDIF